MTLAKQHEPNLYAGMNDSNVEFFTVEGEAKVIANRKIKDFTETPFAIIQILSEAIEKEKPLKMALLDWHPNSRYKRIEQLVKCRFGGLDFQADIKNNTLQEGDYWKCPNRATCSNNGIVCKAPKYNNVELSPLDVSLMELLSTNLTNEVIADKLNLALGSFHKAKKILYAKLGGIQTKQELALIAQRLNII